MSTSFSVGQRVRHGGTGEVGVLIHLWFDPDMGCDDAYVAFLGDVFPQGKPNQRPYVLRYATSSLENYP